MLMPPQPKIYHIVHVDRLKSIVTDDYLWCDSEILKRQPPGTAIGMNTIKHRRLTTHLSSYPNLCVGDCVPFYFCPRSIMLYMIYRANHPELTYRGGQGPIVHLEADLYQTVAWAKKHGKRWAFTLSNAGASYFEDRCDLTQLDEINWNAVQATVWRQYKEGKQAEFLIEQQFPWALISHIGVLAQRVYQQVMAALGTAAHKPPVEIKPDWYY